MKRIVILIVVFAVYGVLVPAQDLEPDPTLYYAYPGSLGVTYRQITPLADFSSSFFVQELALTGRLPLSARPRLVPLAKIGLLQFDSQDELLPEKWDHNHYYAAPGLGLVQRLSREFELGFEVFAGLSQSVFPNALDEPVGSLNILGGADATFTLNPSFNVSIDVTPGLRYLHPLSPFSDYAGLSFGFGVSAHYRFGQDPDSPQAEIRSLRVSEPEVDAVFAAMQSYYVTNPIGTVTIENSESFPVEDVRVSFFQNGYMDSPTPSARIPILESGERQSIDLLASYNAEIFSLEGITPLNGEVIVSYVARGRPAEQRETISYDLHDKTALTWDDNRKMGSFITPADSAIRNYTSFIRQSGIEDILDSASEPLQIAMLAYHALEELGVIYQIDPTSPFTEVQNNTTVVDSVSLPRDTLLRLTGDCDDLTALYATMLETVGIETAFITTPGHIYVAFNTGVPARDYLIVHPDRDMLMIIEDRVWVPVEITMLGNGDFLDAWRFGVDEWEKYADSTESRGFYQTRNAQTVYRPVGLRQTDLGLQYGSPERINAAFRGQFQQLSNVIINAIEATAERRGTRRQYNQLGIYAARLGEYTVARNAFERAAQMDVTYIDPRINLGSVDFLQERFSSSIRAYRSAITAIELSGEALPELETTVYINLSKAYFELGEYDDAAEYFELAAAVDPEGAEGFRYLAQSGSAGARASAAQSGPPVLFADQTGD